MSLRQVIDPLRPRSAPRRSARKVCAAAALALSIAFAVLCAAPARADAVHTQGGDVLHGADLRLEGGTLSLKSQAFGEVKVPAKKVRSIATDAPVAVTFTKDAMLVGRIVLAGPGTMRILGADGRLSAPFSINGVRTVAAAQEREKSSWHSTGYINFGLTVHRGNTDSRLLHVDGKATVRRGKSRYSARGDAKFRRENDEELANDALLKFKHDYFITERWYLYTGAGFEHDSESDLDLRSDLGTGAGYQIVDTPRAAVSVEGGPSYVIADFAEGEDKQYPALRWSADLRYDPVIAKLSLFHNHEILANLSADGGTVFRSRSGVHYRMADGLTASVLVKHDWESDPAPGERESETTYLLTLGYAW
jgi:putative salt-induced outer membrane protein YdiY